MSSSEDRAARRRAAWSGDVVRVGEPKRGLYEDLSPTERLRALTLLNERTWAAAGIHRLATPRSSWPGEILDLRRRIELRERGDD